MNFDLKWDLIQFRSGQKELFDENDKRYLATPISNNTAELMFKLINGLEGEVLRLEYELGKLNGANI